MRVFSRLGMLGVSAAIVITATAIPAQAAATNYVALGDSYSSGTGTHDYFDEDCQRSNQSYGAQVAAAQGYNLDLAACAGAEIPDVQANQLSHLSADTNLITMSIGGNDTGWSDIVTSCARPWPWTCWGDIDEAEAFVRDTLPGQLDGLYNQISEAAPNAHVIIVGYPRLFNGEECNVITRISTEEQERLNGAADLLASTISGIAGSHGFDYVDAIPAFEGHAVCDDEEWLNGLSNPIGESYHPNALGHDAYTTEVTAKL
jgi:lysophospholipase L1-like esterase